MAIPSGVPSTLRSYAVAIPSWAAWVNKCTTWVAKNFCSYFLSLKQLLKKEYQVKIASCHCQGNAQGLS